ncbi:MAG: TetR/AcrR family transcriptional regulator [Saprospiraceae bacterium]|nr:TetR/AcrR family transcriptional regulator [Saprospiraceae bacterium]
MQKAEDLYRKIGFRAITMDELSSQLGISKKTIYQFFEDKDALVDAIMENQISITQQDCAICHEMATNAIDEIFITMEMITQDFQDLNPIVIHDLHKFHPNTFEKFSRHKNEFIYEIIRKNIERGISEGLYRPDLDIDVLTRLRLGTMMLAFNQDVFPSDRYNLIRITSVLMEHFLHGIVTEEGYRLIKEYKKTHNTI